MTLGIAPQASQSSRYAASSGCCVLTGIRQSMPSSSIDNWAGVSDTPPADGEDVALERVLGQCGLHQRGQAVEALAHVGVAGHEPHPVPDGSPNTAGRSR